MFKACSTLLAANRLADGGIMAGTLWLTGQILPVSLAWIIAIIAACLLRMPARRRVSGLLDGFGGGTTRERTLAIMKDSHIGSYGVIGLNILFPIAVYRCAICL